MINNFKCKETEKIFNGHFSKKLPQSIQQIALRKLELLDYACQIEDLKIPPSNRLERLGRDRKEQYSIRINDQWRICFKWIDNHAFCC